MEYAHAYLIIKVMHILDVARNVSWIQTVQETRLVFQESVAIHVLDFVAIMPFAKHYRTFQCAFALMEWKEMHLFNATQSEVGKIIGIIVSFRLIQII